MTNRSEEREKEILLAIEKRLTPYYLPPYMKLGGHDVTHCRRMCRIAEKIWPALQSISGIKEAIQSGEITLFLAKMAVWLHNLDRSTEFADRPEEVTIKEILRQFPEIKEEEIQGFVYVILNHSKVPREGEPALLHVLRYCDMLDMGAIGILRIGAYRHIPYVSSDFIASQTLPGESADKLASALAAVSRVIEWWTKEGFLPAEIKVLDWVREKFEFMILFQARCIKELKELCIA